MANPGAAPAPAPAFRGLDPWQEELAKDVAASIAVSFVTHPFLATKTLIQLGHEPFPLSTGRKYIVAGREAFFLPNTFSYAKQLAQTHPSGWAVLMTGFDSSAMSLIAGRFMARWATEYLDAHFPDMGGKPENLGRDERHLTDGQSFRRMVRAAIRDSTVRTIGIFAARPFTVVCIRQLAQLIGGEAKYFYVIPGLRTILAEEGLGGLFSGVVPQLVAELMMVWGVSLLTFGAERLLTRSGLDQGPDREQAERDYRKAQRAISILAPLIIRPASYPYSVVSTVMACVGSGLIVSILPYNPTFNHWQDCYAYLRPLGGFRRGANLFLREHTGAVSVGMDKQLYASSKRVV